MAFQPKITKARFAYSRLNSEQMLSIGNDVLKDVTDRIKRAENCDDSAAKPLKPGKNGKPGYPDWKQKKGVAPVRNWMSPAKWPRGRLKLMRALKVKEVNQNRAVIGFIDPNVDRIAHLNNKIDKMFGMSPKNKDLAVRVVNQMLRTTRMFYVRKAG